MNIAIMHYDYEASPLRLLTRQGSAYDWTQYVSRGSLLRCEGEDSWHEAGDVVAATVEFLRLINTRVPVDTWYICDITRLVRPAQGYIYNGHWYFCDDAHERCKNCKQARMAHLPDWRCLYDVSYWKRTTAILTQRFNIQTGAWEPVPEDKL